MRIVVGEQFEMQMGKQSEDLRERSLHFVFLRCWLQV